MRLPTNRGDRLGFAGLSLECGAEQHRANAADAAALQMLALMYDAIATEVCGHLPQAVERREVERCVWTTDACAARAQAPCLDLVPLLPAAGWTKERALGLEDIQVCAVLGRVTKVVSQSARLYTNKCALRLMREGRE